MVAVMRPRSPAATNLVRNNRRVAFVGADELVIAGRPRSAGSVRGAMPREPLVEGRRRPRVPVALRAWVCTEALSVRGFALDLTENGARFGGMGLKLKVGDAVIVKIVVDEADAPVVIKGEVVRYAPTAGACPDVCVRFVDAPVDEHFRVARFLDRSGPAAPAARTARLTPGR